MPYQMKAGGLAEISETLSRMEQGAPQAAAKALYKGAGIMAEEVKKGAEEIQTAPFKYAGSNETRLPSPEEKAVVLAAKSVGIAKFRRNGTEVDTSVGYAKSGYARMIGKLVPIPKIANAINSGTSFMKKQPFFRKAKNAGGKKAIQAMKESIEQDFAAMTK